MAERIPPWAIAAGILVAAVIAYLPALRAGFIWDDGVLTENALIRARDGWWRFWLTPADNAQETHYWPLVYTTFWLEYRLWELRPAGYHAVNILLHAACSLLAWRLLSRLGVPGAALIALLFAVHPVHVESVAWVAERKDVLSGALYLAAALAYLRHHDTQRTGAYLAALAWFVLALFSKSIVVTLPFALALAIWWKDGVVHRTTWRKLVPFVGVAAAVTAFDLWRFYDLSTATEVPASLAERLQIAGRAFWFYPLKVVWPTGLVALYPHWQPNVGAATDWVPFIAALVGMAFLWFQSRTGRRGIFFGGAFYAVTILPALGLIKHGFMDFAWVADRFQYLASLGMIGIVGVALTKWARHPAVTRAGFLGSGVLALVLGGLTWRQAALYRDHVTLFEHAVRVHRDNWRAWCQLSAGYWRAERPGDAIAAVDAAIALKPPEVHQLVLERAMMQAASGRHPEAFSSFRQALEIFPEYPEAHREVGRLHRDRGEWDKAIAAYTRAVRANPAFAGAAHDLGETLLAQGRREDAVVWLRRAAALEPENAAFQASLARATWRADERKNR